MVTSQKLTRNLSLFIAGLGLMGQLNIAWSAPLSPPPDNAVLPPVVTQAPLRISELEAETALQVEVSFTAKSQPLGDLLLELQKQSHLVLVAGSNTPASSVKVTAYIQDLPLSQVLLGLSRLYGVRWVKTDATTFVMLPSDKGKLETGLLQLGDYEQFTGRFLESQRNSPEHLDWPQEITRTISEQDLRNGATPQISTLPPELLSKIRHEKEGMAALRLVEMYQAAMEASVDNYVLRAEVPVPPPAVDGKPAPPPASPRIVVRTMEGKGVASLNVRPSFTPPKGKDTAPNQPTRNIPGPT